MKQEVVELAIQSSAISVKDKIRKITNNFIFSDSALEAWHWCCRVYTCTVYTCTVNTLHYKPVHCKCTMLNSKAE